MHGFSVESREMKQPLLLMSLLVVALAIGCKKHEPAANATPPPAEPPATSANTAPAAPPAAPAAAPIVITPLADWAAKNGIKKVVTLVTDFGPGIDAENAFKSRFTANGGQVLAELRAPLRNPDFAPFLQRVRDEAHRFAIGYHQKVHKKGVFASALDGIPGLGPKRRRALS